MCGLLNGLCTVDQTLFGLNLGILLAFTCEYALRRPVDRHVTKLMNGEYAGKGYGSLLQKSLLLILGAVLISTVLYLTLPENLSTNHKDWLYNISLDCNILPHRKLQFAEVELATSAFLFSVYGAYLGLIIDAKYFQGSPKDIHQTLPQKSLLRFLLLWLFIAPFLYIITVYVARFEFLPTKLGIFYLLPTFTLSLLLYGFSKLLYGKVGLLAHNNLNQSGQIKN